jgi:hypothetical protein
MGSTNIVVLLADHVLSVLHVTEGQRPVKLTQVLQLDKSCIAERLMTFSDFAKADFAVICKHLTIHFASINPNLNVTLEALSDQCRNNEGGVLMERGSEVQAVSYVGANIINICLVSSGFVETPSLPQNVICVTDAPATLYAVHAPETFLLHCETADGFTLYVVHVPVDTNLMNARAIRASGDPYSSDNGTFIVMVDGQRVTAYITGDSNVPGNAKGFSSQITTLEFLNNHHVLILTEDGQHIVMDLQNSSSQPTYFSGGAPTTWTWVDSDIYIYTTKNDGLSTIHVFNMTSDKEIFEVKDITMQPERVLFVEKSAISPTPPPPPPGRDDNTRVIAGATIGSVLLILVPFVVVVATVAILLRNKTPRTSRTSHTKLIETQIVGIGSKPPTPTPTHSQVQATTDPLQDSAVHIPHGHNTRFLNLPTTAHGSRERGSPGQPPAAHTLTPPEGSSQPASTGSAARPNPNRRSDIDSPLLVGPTGSGTHTSSSSSLSSQQSTVSDTAVTSTNIGAMATTSDDIDATAATGTNIGATAATVTNIGATAATGTNIGATAATGTNIGATAATVTNIGATATMSDNIGATAATSTNIGATAATSTNIGATAATSTNIGATAATSTNIGATAATSTNIGATAATSTNIDATAAYTAAPPLTEHDSSQIPTTWRTMVTVDPHLQFQHTTGDQSPRRDVSSTHADFSFEIGKEENHVHHSQSTEMAG